MTADIVRETENNKRAAGRLRELKRLLLAVTVAMSGSALIVAAMRSFQDAVLGAVTITGIGGAILVGSWLARKNKPKDELVRILRFLPFAGFGMIPGLPNIDWAFLYI